MRWVVRHFTRGVNNSGPAETKQYLYCLNHNPYNRHDRTGLTTLFVDTVDDAFQFETQAAAEFAAVFIGGEIDELPNK